MYDTPRESIPADVLAALTPEEGEAFFKHDDYFARLAAEATHPGIKRYLERIGTQDIFWLMLYSVDEAPYRVYFHHTIVEASESFRIRLPKPAAVPAHLPKEVCPIYESLGGLRQEYGGLICPEDIQSVEAGDCWLSEDNRLDPSSAFLFYDFGDGDSLGYTTSADGVLYEHELGVLSPADLQPFIAEGFEQLLASSYDAKA
jgi:hypothetical protein